jgi:hypothetical protein
MESLLWKRLQAGRKAGYRMNMTDVLNIGLLQRLLNPSPKLPKAARETFVVVDTTASRTSGLHDVLNWQTRTYV